MKKLTFMLVKKTFGIFPQYIFFHSKVSTYVMLDMVVGDLLTASERTTHRTAPRPHPGL